jgi:hypothetical protein
VAVETVFVGQHSLVFQQKLDLVSRIHGVWKMAIRLLEKLRPELIAKLRDTFHCRFEVS